MHDREPVRGDGVDFDRSLVQGELEQQRAVKRGQRLVE